MSAAFSALVANALAPASSEVSDVSAATLQRFAQLVHQYFIGASLHSPTQVVSCVA